MSKPPPSPASLAMSRLSDARNKIKRGRLAEAEQILAEAISLDETNAAVWHVLGQTWSGMGRTSDAIDALTMATNLDPANAGLRCDLGLALLSVARDADGLNQLAEAFRLKPDPKLAAQIADLHFARHAYDQSSFYYLNAYKTLKNDELLHYKLSVSLYRNGDTDQALGLMVQLVLRYPHKKKYIYNLTDFYRRRPNLVFNSDAKKAVEICLSQDKLKFLNLRPVWSSLLLLDPAYAHFRQFARQCGTDTQDAASPTIAEIAPALGSFFLCAGLEHNMVAGIPLEYIMTNLRHYFLSHIDERASWPKDTMPFLSALAVQCWFSDYVYYVTHEEERAVERLGAELKSHVAENGAIRDAAHAVLLCLYACYEPLTTVIESREQIDLPKATGDILAPLILHQLVNPLRERELRSTIGSFTEIEDATSKDVQSMYEQRPYPRWTSANVEDNSDDVKALSKGMGILVAGCGTGQETAYYANIMPYARITAIDLSRTSLAYAKRQAEDLGFADRITFLHGDLMEAAKLGASFDYITSSGVLHHLKDPEKGLAAIRPLLKPHGRMSLSLYSRAARAYTLGPAEQFIKDKGYDRTASSIRQFRRDLFFLQANDPILRCSTTSDFFNLSECTDLLFHVQEHRFSLTEFRDLASRHGLSPVRISMTPEASRQFNIDFPGIDPLNFDSLSRFEDQYPQTFIEMYKVYFRPSGSDMPHPLDPLIRLGAI